MALKLGTPSALNLTLQGSVGSFSVGHGSNGHSSLEVKYFLTHVSFDFEMGTSAEVYSTLFRCARCSRGRLSSTNSCRGRDKGHRRHYVVRVWSGHRRCAHSAC
jgi:hypothetical protein